MSDSLTYEQHVARLAELVADEDPEGLARHVVAHIALHSETTPTRVLDLLRTLPKPTLLRLVRALIELEPTTDRLWSWELIRLIGDLTGRLPAELSDEDMALLLEFAVREQWSLPVNRIAALVEWQRARGEVGADVVELVQSRTADSQRMRQLAVELTGPGLTPRDPWAGRILADLPGLDPVWRLVVGHAATATTAKPSGSWTKTAVGLLAGVDPDKAHDVLAGWVDVAAQPPTRVPDSTNADILRGLLWMLALTPMRPDTVRMLGALTEAMVRRLPGIGPACPKVANAAVGVLANVDGEPALAQLARLTNRVTYRGTLNEIEKALDARAAALGLSRDDVEELAVPAFGLTEVGGLTVAFGGDRAALTVGHGGVSVAWRGESGKQVKSPPAAVRREHPERLAELKATVKDISSMLSAQVERLDRLFLARRTWTGAAWRQRYLDHPLVGTLARRLIWLVDGVACGYADGALRTVADAELTVADSSTVELWHPIGRPVAEVVAWRDWLERHRIVQPFKQAHREVYLLTPAEATTGVYSNRFAGHILRQHQFRALTLARGWRNKLRLVVDDESLPPSRDLPQWGLRAEYWVEGISGNGQGYTAMGTYLQLASDQVRFYPIDAAENRAYGPGGRYSQGWAGHRDPSRHGPVPLAQVPPLVFSEVMRDVDLFVGVASVGNDPTWSDGGPQGRFRDYWTSYSFGELSATARTRRDLLARLLPRLALGARASVDGRFLVVRGDLRTYKIHLGSGNILMSPNDAYLCIVPDQRKQAGTGDMLLPFEGDTLLAVILSKAMLLAKDSQITDPTITQQIGTTRETAP